jgi:hypothetical protein
MAKDKKLSDVELNQKCAEWLGLDFKVLYVDCEIRLVKYIKNVVDYSKVFDPLNNWQQFMEMVLPKFTKTTRRVIIGKGDFIIGNVIKPGMLRRHFPSDLRRAVLEMISEEGIK